LRRIPYHASAEYKRARSPSIPRDLSAGLPSFEP
jgi:hypothetical protein